MEQRDRLYQNCIEELGYEIISPLQVGNRALYTVKKDGDIRVAKLGSPKFPKSANQVRTENKALIAAQGIPGVVQKISYHQIFHNEAKVYVLIRDYVEGVNLGEEGIFLDQEQKLRLKKTVRALHQRGITNLDLYYGNVVINLEGIPYLFDLGLARFREQGLRDHRIHAKEDLSDLKKMFQRYGEPEY